MKNFIYIIKGIIIGIATLVPGVSGGTMAIILDLYDDMIKSINTFFKDIKNNAIFLLTVGLGVIIGIFAFSRLIESFLNQYYLPMLYLFIGAVAGGIPVLYKKTTIGNKSKKDWFYFVIGVLIILLMSVNSGVIVNLADSTGILRFAFLIFAGIIIAIALILPGISTSFMLLVIGLYDVTLKAINNLDFAYLIPICVGVFLGVIAVTKMLAKYIDEKPRQTYMLILGFVMGSVIELYPGLPIGLDLIASIITFIVGLVIIRYISIKMNHN